MPILDDASTSADGDDLPAAAGSADSVLAIRVTVYVDSPVLSDSILSVLVDAAVSADSVLPVGVVASREGDGARDGVGTSAIARRVGLWILLSKLAPWNVHGGRTTGQWTSAARSERTLLYIQVGASLSDAVVTLSNRQNGS